jgi:regulator of protease activity HflC (stomatin/prohibitin superfamily)
MPWLIFAIVVVPVLVVLTWLLLDESIVRIPPGRLGLLLVRGVPTDQVVEPGSHWVPALRRRTVVEYPALELSFRAGDVTRLGDDAGLERSGPPVVVSLGDGATVAVAYTVRFRLATDALRQIHVDFGPDGLWSAVRDLSAGSLRRVLAADRSRDDVLGSRRAALEAALGAAITEELAAHGLDVVMFALGDVAADRAGDLALRYRELEMWREVGPSGRWAVLAPAPPEESAS